MHTSTQINASSKIQKKHFTNFKYYPWIVITLCASILFYKYILTVSPSIMVHDLMKQFQISGIGMGHLAATFFYAFTVGQIFSGVLIDRFGVRFLSGFAILICALGAWLFSIADMLGVAILARALMGIGCSFATVAYLKMAAVWFKPTQLAFVSGLLCTAVMLGAVFGQLPLAWMLEQTDWRFVLFFCSILGVVVGILFILIVRDQPKEPLLHTVQESAPTLKQGLTFNDIKDTLKNKQNWLLTLYSGLVFSPLSVLGGLWGNPFLQEAHNLTLTQAAQMSSIMFIGLGVGSPLFGYFSDRMGVRVPFMKIGAVISFISIICIIWLPIIPTWLLAVLFFIFGCNVGTFMLAFTVGTETNRLVLAATVIALINTGDSLFESFTEPLIGFLLDFSGNGLMLDGAVYFTVANYRTALSILPIYFLLGLFILFFVKEKRR
jgi:sugar phosphate permease